MLSDHELAGRLWAVEHWYRGTPGASRDKARAALLRAVEARYGALNVASPAEPVLAGR